MNKFSECRFAAMCNCIDGNTLDAFSNGTPMPFITPACRNKDLVSKSEEDILKILGKEPALDYVLIKHPCVCRVCCYFERK